MRGGKDRSHTVFFKKLPFIFSYLSAYCPKAKCEIRGALEKY